LANWKGAVDAALAGIAMSCPGMASLDLSNCTGFTAPGLGKILEGMLLRPKGPDRGPLRKLNLSYIAIKPTRDGVDRVVQRVLTSQAENPSGPVLEELRVEGNAMLSSLPLKSICETGVKSKRQMLSALRVFSCAESSSNRGTWVLPIDGLQYACPNLELLDISRVGGFYGLEIQATEGSPSFILAEGLPQGRWAKLGVLRAGQGACKKNISEEQFFSRLPKNAQSLREINLDGWELSFELLAFVRAAVGLKRLSLRSSSAPVVVFTPLLDHFHDQLEMFLRQYEVCSRFQYLEVIDVSLSPFGDEQLDYLDFIDLGALCGGLKELCATATSITTDGLRRFLLTENGLPKRPEGFRIHIDSCRGIDRPVRQASSRGMPQVLDALGRCEPKF